MAFTSDSDTKNRLPITYGPEGGVEADLSVNASSDLSTSSGTPSEREGGGMAKGVVISCHRCWPYAFYPPQGGRKFCLFQFDTRYCMTLGRDGIEFPHKKLETGHSRLLRSVRKFLVGAICSVRGQTNPDKGLVGHIP